MTEPSTCFLDGFLTPTTASLSVIPPAIIAAIIALVGHYCIQVWVQRRMRAVEELKSHLYSYLELTLDYWMNENSGKPQQGRLEVQMIAKHSIITTEFSNLSKICARVRFFQRRQWKAFSQTKEVRLELWNTATGGCFQQRHGWKTDPVRAMVAARLVSRLVEYIN